MNRIKATLWRLLDPNGYQWHLRRESLREFFDTPLQIKDDESEEQSNDDEYS